MSGARRDMPVDHLFAQVNEPTPPPIGERIAAQTPGWVPVTATAGEMRSYEHLDKRLDFLANEIRDGFRTLGDQLAEFAKMYGPRIERIEQRQDDFERRVARLENKRKKRK
jgi:hypothetical protein